MSADERFFDTNILLYLLSSEPDKADRAEDALAGGGVISVQVLNEFASVAMRKLKMPIAEITEETHDKGLEVAERYGLSVYDAMIVASAVLARCKILLSEDMQDRQVLAGSLELRNPFG
jgi:predicted nucleic acid-binding protein